MADSSKIIDTLWDDNPVDVTTEVNFIWSIANKLRGTYQKKQRSFLMSIIQQYGRNAPI